MTTKKKKTSSPPSKSIFAESLFTIAHRFSLSHVFEDFLTMSIAACTQNLQTGVSYYEDEYLQTIAPYKNSELRHEFPKAFAFLIEEMEERTGSNEGNDVLGEFFEQHISNGRNGQFFTPYHICQFMSSITHTEVEVDEESKRPLRIADPSCGSGRMLLAAHRPFGQGHEYYGIDIDRTCVKMTALNMFLNGMWRSETMCANALMPGDFVIAYRISLFPLGIFKIEEKEKSLLWHIRTNSFKEGMQKDTTKPILVTPGTFCEPPKNMGTQLDLF